jgi:high-affinity Fe2+/Pb2+ permease
MHAAGLRRGVTAGLISRYTATYQSRETRMPKSKVLGIFAGLLAALAAYFGIVDYLGDPQPHGSLLAMGVLLLFLCLQSLSGASREAQYWMAMALGTVSSAYGFLELFTKDPDQFWTFLAFAGLLFIVVIVVLWRRKDHGGTASSDA